MNIMPEEGLHLFIKKNSTSMTMRDLVVKDETFVSLQIMENWLKARKEDSKIITRFANAFSGFRAVFTGPAGTGKAFAASLLGKQTGYDVYCIDLSFLVSRYIGETEKNLDKLISRAEVSDVILFFDEADALFGKRTGIEDAHDRYSNAEISILLQRIEAFKGILVLSFSKLLNRDSPFFKRINLVVEFEKPNKSQRLKLWRKYLPMPVQQEMGFEVDEIARKYKITGGEIVRIISAAGNNIPEGLSKVHLLKELKDNAK